MQLGLVFLSLVWSASQPSGSLLQDGLIALQRGDLTKARDDLEQAAKADPESAYVWSSLAETYLRLKLPQQASEAAVRAEKTGSRSPLVWHALAMYYSEAGQAAHAAELEQRFAESPGADANALSRAASLYLEAGNAGQALVLAERATEKAPSPEAEDVWGRALTANGKSNEAVQHFEIAWSGAKTNPQIAFDYAESQLKGENFTRAAEVIQSALADHPRDPQLVLALGVARYGQRRFEDSISAFLQVIQIDPSIEQPYVFLGRMMEQASAHLGEITKAYEAWVARDPSSAKAQLLLAKALLAQDHHSERAEALLRRSISLNPRDWESHYELGVLLAGRKDYPEAAAELSRSIEIDPKEPMPHYHLARVFDRLGQPERAKAEREIHAALTGKS